MLVQPGFMDLPRRPGYPDSGVIENPSLLPLGDEHGAIQPRI
jgi:hypothetical protein